jgi:hypothetical protein
MIRRILVAALAVAMAGCAYRTGYTVRKDIHTIAVPVFSNDTFYRNLEIDLTREVITAVEKRTPYKIAGSKSADAVLEGRITGYKTVVLQEDAKNNPTENEIVLTVQVIVKDTRSGKVLYKGDVREGDNFSTPAGDTELETRMFLFRRAAVRIVEAALEEDW